MIGFLKLIVCFGVYFLVLNNAECQVTVSNLNGTGYFLCGHRTLLECYIPGYSGGMNWKLDGTIIAQCAFGSCTALGALPSGDDFTFDGSAGKFNLNIGITHADNGTKYQCDDGAVSDQTTVNIQVPPSESAFTTTITANATSITVEAGCFYPPDAGRMDVICVDDGNEVGTAITMTPTTTGCTGDCAGPNIYTAVGNYDIDSSKTEGTSSYRFKVYHKDFEQYAITKESPAKYNCEKHSTSPPPCSSTPPPPGTTCIIIIVVCVVELLIIIIIIVCCCIRKRKQNKATKGLNLAEMNDKNDQNNIPLGEPVPDGMNEKKQDLNNKPTGESVHNEINEKKQDLNKVERKF